MGPSYFNVVVRDRENREFPYRTVSTVMHRRFFLVRESDVTGVSGGGVVASGVRFQDGKVAVRWIVGHDRSTVVWDSVDSCMAIHGHDGATRLVWVD